MYRYTDSYSFLIINNYIVAYFQQWKKMVISTNPIPTFKIVKPLKSRIIDEGSISNSNNTIFFESICKSESFSPFFWIDGEEEEVERVDGEEEHHCRDYIIIIILPIFCLFRCYISFIQNFEDWRWRIRNPENDDENLEKYEK